MSSGRAFAELRAISPTLATPENQNILPSNASQARNVVAAIKVLQEANPVLVTQDNFVLLIQCVTHQVEGGSSWRSNTQKSGITDALKILQRSDPALVTQDNLLALSQNLLYANGIATVLALLSQANPSLATPENRALLIQQAQHASVIASVLEQLRNSVTQDIFIILIKHANDIGHIRDVVDATLRQSMLATPGILNTPENLARLLQHIEDIPNIARAFEKLKKIQQSIVNWHFTQEGKEEVSVRQNVASQENLDLLIEHAHETADIAQGLDALSKVRPSLATQENFELLVQHAQHARSIAEGFEAMIKADPSLATQQNLNLLFQYPKVAAVFAQLVQINPTLGTQPNFEALIKFQMFSQEIKQQLAEEKANTQQAFMKLMKRYVIVKDELLTINPALATQENIDLLTSPQYYKYASDIIAAFKLLKEATPDLATQKNLEHLIQRAQHANHIAEEFNALINITKELQLNRMDAFYPTLATPANFQNLILIQRPDLHDDAQSGIVKGLMRLLNESPMYVTQDNFKALIQSVNYADDMAKVLIYLSTAIPRSLATLENRALLTQYADQLTSIARVLQKLEGQASQNADNKSLITQDSLSILIQHADVIWRSIFEAKIHKHALLITGGFNTRENADLLLRHFEQSNNILAGLDRLEYMLGALTQNTINLLIEHAKDVPRIIAVLDNLENKYNLTFTKEIFSWLIPNAEHAHEMAGGLVNLIEIGFDTPANRAMLQQNGKYALGIADMLIILNKMHLDTTPPVNRIMLSQHAQSAKDIAESLNAVWKADPNLITQQNLDKFFQHAQHARDIGKGFKKLRKPMPSFANQQNLDLLFQYPEHASAIGSMFKELKQIAPGLATQQNLETLIEYRFSSQEIKQKLAEAKLETQSDFKKFMTSFHTVSNAAEILSQAVRTDAAQSPEVKTEKQSLKLASLPPEVLTGIATLFGGKQSPQAEGKVQQHIEQKSQSKTNINANSRKSK